MTQHGTFHDLITAMAEPGCPVCRLVDAATRARIDMLFYEQLTLVEIRAEIRAARGFCSAHASLLPGPTRMAGNAILHHDVLNDVTRQLGELAPRRTGSFASILALAARGAIRAARDVIAPKRACVLCDYEREQEVLLLRALARDLGDRRMYEAFKASQGLCLPHFHAALGVSDVSVERLTLLIDLQRAHLERTRDELSAWMAKQNGSYDFEAPDLADPQGDAPSRAARLVSGRVIHTDGRR